MSIESTPSTSSPSRAAALRGLCGGAVHLPGDPGYDEARMPWNVAVDQHPAAVAYPANAAEVSAVVRAAKTAGLRVAPQGTGHNAGPLGSLEDVVLLRTAGMTGVSVDPVTRIARAEAGALWLDVVEAAEPFGLAALHGSSPDVGVVGYSLGGGIGWYARKLGLATNSITAVELVIADGTILRADEHNEPELFWALRGGGGSFGVVTALEFRLYPIETAYAGMLVWDQSQADEVLRAWARWTDGAPDSVSSAFRMLNLPPMPELPAALRGRRLAVIDGAVLEDDEDAVALLSALRALRPEIDTFARVPAASLVRLHMDPEGPTPSVSATVNLDGLPEAAIESFLALTGPGSSSTLLSAELRHLGGALGRPQDGAGAMPMLEGRFLVFGVAIAMTPQLARQGHADAVSLMAALAPYGSGRHYLNFAEDRVDVSTGYPADSWLQLKGIRSAVDPSGVFVANHQVPRLYENGAPTP